VNGDKMSRELYTLIRLYKYRVDEKRRALRELLGEVASLEKESEVLENQIISEQTVAKSASDNIGMFYGEYAKVAVDKRKKIKEEIIIFEDRISLAQEEMRLEYKEMKVFDITQNSRDEFEAKELLKEEQGILDELSQEVHRRKYLSKTI
jgi:hypothetical protein